LDRRHRPAHPRRTALRRRPLTHHNTPAIAGKGITMSASQPRFLKLTDDQGQHVATRDTLTGVEYAHVPLDAPVNHEQALAAAAALDTLGGGWRLAGYNDATAIGDVSRESPAVDTAAFPWIQPRWYWLRD